MAAPPTPNSATGGYIVPVAPAPLDDAALEDLFHDVIQGLLGFTDGKLIRPRFQPNPPNMPGFDEDWVSFSITPERRDFSPYLRHTPEDNDGAGSTTSEQDQRFTMLLSFYGPNAGMYQGLFEDGIKIEQNREALDAAGIAWQGNGDSFRLPALMKERWVNRLDQRAYFSRRIIRTYPVLSLASASVRSLDNEQYLTDIDIQPNQP